MPLSSEVTDLEAKLKEIKALHARWRVEDEKEALENQEDLVTRQKQRCREIGLFVFDFTLRDAQVDAIWTLFYERRDLLLLSKTGSGKSLIFQLIPFMVDPTGVVLILMPLKLLQAEQNSMINCIPNGKAIALTGENNQKAVQQAIATEGYTHVFTSPEIALSKKFKANVLDNRCFSDRLSLLAIDEKYLVEEWSKSFRPLYTEIDKVRKRMPNNVPLLGVSATLTKKMRLRILNKVGFRDNYRLMQTSLDRPEIQQIHQFMRHTRASCLDLQFILPPQALSAKDIQKTIIFVNSVSDICPMIEIIRGWMKQLGYPEGSDQWIKPYHSTMSDWDKAIIAKAFKVNGEKNTKCTILVATDAYGMGIDNPDIKLVIHWDLSLSFDSMIQRMGRAGRKGGQAAFVLLTPKWTQVKDQDEIDKRLEKRSKAANANTQLSDQNRPSTFRPSPLNQGVDAEDLSDNESVAASMQGDDFEDSGTNELFDLLTPEAEEVSRNKKHKKKASQTDAAKRANLPDEIFDCIHVAKCRRLFSLAWYDNETYVSPSTALPTPCCNGPSCNSEDPEYLQRASLVNTAPVRYTEIEREWMAFMTSELKKWRKAKSKAYWLDQGVEDEMPESVLMTNDCLMALVKKSKDLDDEEKVYEFLQPWPSSRKYYDEIFACILQSNSQATKPQRKEALKEARARKKAKFMDDEVVTAAARITELRDQWLLKYNKMTPDLKARLKKAKQAEQKQLAKLDKQQAKAKEQAQINDIRRLALTNKQFGAFRELLSDPASQPGSDPPDPCKWST